MAGLACEHFGAKSADFETPLDAAIYRNDFGN